MNFQTGDTVKVEFGGESFEGVVRSPTRLIRNPGYWLVDFIHDGEPLTLAFLAEDIEKVQP